MTRQICHLDTETYSECDLKHSGMYAYAEHPTTDLLCAAYAFNDGPVHLWVPRRPSEFPADAHEALKASGKFGLITVNEQCPADLARWIEAGGHVGAHNSAFERRILNGHVGKRHRFPKMEIRQMICTAAKAASHGLPRYLEGAAAALGGPQKNTTGQNAMRQLCKPRTGEEKRYSMADHWDKYMEMYLYCGDDVIAERSIDDQVPDLTPEEYDLWALDQLMNDRGIGVDKVSVDNCIFLVKELRAEMSAICQKMTGFTPGQTAKLADWIRNHPTYSYPLLDLTAPVIKAAAADPKCPALIKTVLNLRAAHAMKAVDKYTAIAGSMMADERIRGMFMFYGANTGRWSSVIVQLQNLFRPLESVGDPELAIEAFRARSVDWIRGLYDDHPMSVLASAIRSVLWAGKGNDLLCLDYSQVEARITAWLAGQMDVLLAFEAFDRGEGPDIYTVAAAQIYNKPVAEITKAERQMGKIAVLALGFQGGAGAFESMARLYGIHVDVQTAERIKAQWRAANKAIVQMWYDLENAAINAVANPGKAYGLKNKKIAFKVVGRWLYMRLPGNRKIAYFEPKLDAEGKLTYMGIDTYTRQWGRVNTYGGKLCENAVQATARDLLAAGLLRLEDAGYNPVGSVHDEAITEPPTGFGSIEEAEEIFMRAPAWAAKLPIACESWRGARYRK